MSILINGKGMKNHEKTTLLERMTLKMVYKIVNMFYLIVKMFLQISKLKKEVLADLTTFIGAASSTGRAADS